MSVLKFLYAASLKVSRSDMSGEEPIPSPTCFKLIFKTKREPSFQFGKEPLVVIPGEGIGLQARAWSWVPEGQNAACFPPRGGLWGALQGITGEGETLLPASGRRAKLPTSIPSSASLTHKHTTFVFCVSVMKSALHVFSSQLQSYPQLQSLYLHGRNEVSLSPNNAL